MNLSYYQVYRSKVFKEPVNYWRDLMQASINDTWYDTSTVEAVEGQATIGQKIFHNEKVQINSVVDTKTGKTLGDDYRKIIYKNVADSKISKTNQVRYLGKYYKFDDFTWLTINTNTTIGSLATAILQKCNNVLKWYDSNKILHVWDCVFERTLTGTNIDDGSQGVHEVSADTTIKVQLNDETKLIPFNQRFLFNGRAFQVKQINNHISDSYMEIYLYETQIQSNDDIENNIANSIGEVISKETITRLLPETNSILQGQNKQFSIYKYVDGVKQTNTFTITTKGPILDTNYTINIIDGNNFTIENLIPSNKPLVITCVDDLDDTNTVSATILLGGRW